MIFLKIQYSVKFSDANQVAKKSKRDHIVWTKTTHELHFYAQLMHFNHRLLNNFSVSHTKAAFSC